MLFRYRAHHHGHMYFAKVFLCRHTLSFIVHLELEWLLPGNWIGNDYFLETLSKVVLHFKYADNESPGVAHFEVLSRLTKSICTKFSFSSFSWFTFLPGHLKDPHHVYMYFFNTLFIFSFIRILLVCYIC